MCLLSEFSATITRSNISHCNKLIAITVVMVSQWIYLREFSNGKMDSVDSFTYHFNSFLYPFYPSYTTLQSFLTLFQMLFSPTLMRCGVVIGWKSVATVQTTMTTTTTMTMITMIKITMIKIAGHSATITFSTMTGSTTSSMTGHLGQWKVWLRACVQRA